MTACVYVIGRFQLLHMAHVDFLHRAEDLAGAPVRVILGRPTTDNPKKYPHSFADVKASVESEGFHVVPEPLYDADTDDEWFTYILDLIGEDQNRNPSEGFYYGASFKDDHMVAHNLVHALTMNSHPLAPLKVGEDKAVLHFRGSMVIPPVPLRKLIRRYRVGVFDVESPQTTTSEVIKQNLDKPLSSTLMRQLMREDASRDALAWYVFFQRGTLERVPVAPETVYPSRVADPAVAVSLASLLRGVV